MPAKKKIKESDFGVFPVDVMVRKVKHRGVEYEQETELGGYQVVDLRDGEPVLNAWGRTRDSAEYHKNRIVKGFLEPQYKKY